MFTYLSGSSPGRSRPGGVEKEGPGFQRLDRYPMGPLKDCCDIRGSLATSPCIGGGADGGVFDIECLLSRASSGTFASLPAKPPGGSCGVGDRLSGPPRRVWSTAPDPVDALKDGGSEPMMCMLPPYLRAAISCGDSGRDFRRSFCRRFWNQICGTRASSVRARNVSREG